MQTVKISSKGQIVLPKQIRAELNLQEGMELSIKVVGQQLSLEKTKQKTWRKWRGALKGTQALTAHEKEHLDELNHDE